MTDETAELRTELAALRAEVAELRRSSPATEPGPGVVAPDPADEAAGPRLGLVDRRRMLGRAGTAALGALLGGTAVGVVAASPAAAATGTFDSSTSETALTVVNSGTGRAIQASGAGPAPVVEVTGASGITTVEVVGGNTSTGIHVTAKAFGLIATATGPLGIGLIGHTDGGLFGAGGEGKNGAIGLGGYSEDGIGIYGWGQAASLLLGPLSPSEPDTPAPRTSGIAHQRGEVAFDAASELWLCTTSGTPGTWVRLAGPGAAGAFTVLPTPTRVYDTRPGSGLPGAGTGPVTGIRKNIDLTANSSGLPTDATAAMVTLTATNTQPNAQAYGQIYANALTTPPGTSTINWTQANDLVATTTTTALTTGKVTITMNPAANVLIDVIGFWR